jgi:hypothetical protein
MITQAWAEGVKSIKNTASQETIMKTDENKGVLQKRIKPAKEPTESLKKLKARFQSTIAYSVTDYGAIMGSAKLGVNFLKALEEKKKPRLTDSLHKLIYSNEFFQDTWKDKFSSSRELNQTKSPNSDPGQSFLKRYPNVNGDQYFEAGKILSTLKLLHSKREEIFNEIFMGFRFSFDPKSTHMFVEMSIAPSSEKGPGVIIPF